MQTITRDELKGRLDRGEDLALVEVLSEDEFERFHLPGAVNVPIGDGFEHKIEQAVPDKERSVVVYCLDKSCDASPKAAHRMDRLGYQHVYDYQAGKTDWKRAGFPID